MAAAPDQPVNVNTVAPVAGVAAVPSPAAPAKARLAPNVSPARKPAAAPASAAFQQSSPPKIRQPAPPLMNPRSPPMPAAIPLRTCPVGSVYAMGLFTTYAYRFWSCGIDRRPRRAAALRKRPIVGAYHREGREIRFGG